MKMKTSELTDAALDWAVTKCMGYNHDVSPNSKWGMWGWATDWAQGGPIIEQEKMRIAYNFDEHIWEAGWDCHVKGWGNTPLIAAMRCYVASELGDEIDVPDELKGESK